MKNTFIKTKNVKAFISLANKLKQAPKNLPKMGLVYGDPGLGKTNAILWWALKQNAIIITAKNGMSNRWFLAELVSDLGESPAYHTSVLFEQAVRKLIEKPRMLIVDEVDYINEDSKKINYVDISKEWQKDGWKDSKQRNGYNFIDLFSGAGGLSCGLVMAGWTPIGSVEIMEQAVATYKYNFVDKKGFEENVESQDIRNTDVKRHLYDRVWGKNIDLIVGGFPCQGFSMAGNRIVTDDRNTLYLDMLEIVDHLRPKVVVMENVLGLRSMLGGKVEEKIINDYKD